LVIRAGLCSIVLVGAVARLWGIDFGLPHTQARPDETQVMDVSLQYLRGNYWPPFYDYPRFYNYVLTLAYLAYYAVASAAGRFTSLAGFVASWPTDWAPFFLINRSLSALAGTLTVLVAHGIGRRLGGPAAGLVAALFLALAYGHVRESHFGTTDTMLTLLSATAVLCLLPGRVPGDTGRCEQGAAAEPGRAGSGRRQTVRRRDLLAAAFAGLATATKYNGVLLLVPLGLSQVFHAVSTTAGRMRALLDRRAVAVGAVFVLACAVGVPFVVFDYPQFSLAMRDMASVLRTGLAPRANLPNGWWYHASVSLRYGLGLPLLIAGLAGVIIVARRDRRTALLAFSFPLVYFAAAGALGALFVRYALPIVPFLCAGAAVTVLSASAWLGRGRHARVALAVLFAAGLAAPSVARAVAFDRVMARADNRVVASEWMARHAEAGASVMVSGSPYGYPQFERSVVLWPWDRRLRTFVHQGRPVEGRPDWILVQESPLPSTTQPIITELLASGYERLTTLRAFDPALRNNVYDVQDAFFVPFAAFERVRRPGPNFTIYKRLDARYVANPAPGRTR
jgi:4-amino-4-deoxy-L-arabinose transferase-like glycosyltransferase